MNAVDLDVLTSSTEHAHRQPHTRTLCILAWSLSHCRSTRKILQLPVRLSLHAAAHHSRFPDSSRFTCLTHEATARVILWSTPTSQPWFAVRLHLIFAVSTPRNWHRSPDPAFHPR